MSKKDRRAALEAGMTGAEVKEPGPAKGPVAAPSPEPAMLQDEGSAEIAAIDILAAFRPTELIDLHLIDPWPENPGRDRVQENIDTFTDDIVEKGLLQAITLRPRQDTPGRFWIVLGERRWTACCLARASGRFPADYKIEAKIRQLDDRQAWRIAAAENLQREGMTAMAEARLYKQAQDYVVREPGERDIGVAIARFFHVNAQMVYRRLRLLKLVPEAQAALAEKKITLGHAQIIARGSAERQAELFAEPGGIEEIAGMDSDDLEYAMQEDLPAVAEAVFPVEHYEGDIVGGPDDDRPSIETFFADKVQFRTLQRAFLEERAAEIRDGKAGRQPADGKWRWVEIAESAADFRERFTFMTVDLKNGSWHSVEESDPDAGAVVTADDGKIEVRVAITRAVHDQREAERGRRRDENASAESEPANRDPLSKSQQKDLHEAKTHTLRRIIAGDDHLTTALAVIALLGGREVRLGGRGYEGSASPAIDSTSEQVGRIEALLAQAKAPAHPKDKATLGDEYQPGLGVTGIGIAKAEAAWLRALMELAPAELRELHRLLVAERCGSWWNEFAKGNGKDGRLGDTALAIEIASWDQELKGRVAPADWQPSEDYFKGCSVGRLRGFVQAINLKRHARGARAHDLSGAKKSDLVQLAVMDREYLTVEDFPETKFQSDAACAAALATEAMETEPALLKAQAAKQRSDWACIAEGNKVIAAYDQAVRAGKATTPFRERLEAIAVEMNGGSPIGMRDEEGGAWRLMQSLRADDDIDPLWGQPGRFEVELIDDKHQIRVAIRTAGLFQIGSEFAFTAEAVEPGVFLVAGGKRSFTGLEAPGKAAKAGVAAWALAEINAWRAKDEFGKKLKKPRPFVALIDGWDRIEQAELPIAGEPAVAEAAEPQPEPAE